MLIKSANGSFLPATQADIETMQSLKLGKAFGCTLTQLRNGKFHRKAFALLNLMYEQMPRAQVEHNGETIQQSFERFRKEQVIRAGHYHTDVTGRGELRLEAQSISYKECSQELIEQIYSDLIDLALRSVDGYDSADDLDSVVNQILGFS
ncbi:DUF1367 family protein [uncultured Paraglaciecola sp.]|uniref:DUF1367 family protein n=1 Tax=uncultured Paraglaciecola sp. TaxID=1765024 RepID=UPI00262D5833|nr:DUF1367 family protein [uncultured Paraglaciecola sp.]